MRLCGLQLTHLTLVTRCHEHGQTGRICGAVTAGRLKCLKQVGVVHPACKRLFHNSPRRQPNLVPSMGKAQRVPAKEAGINLQTSPRHGFRIERNFANFLPFTFLIWVISNINEIKSIVSLATGTLVTHSFAAIVYHAVRHVFASFWLIGRKKWPKTQASQSKQLQRNGRATSDQKPQARPRAKPVETPQAEPAHEATSAP